MGGNRKFILSNIFYSSYFSDSHYPCNTMRVVVQRVSSASVVADGVLTGSIGKGLMLLVGIAASDEEPQISAMVKKIAGLRIFSDSEGKMNLSVKDVNGAILVVSQFTLLADTKKGFRPSFIAAARPEKAIPFYEKFIQLLENEIGTPVQKGVFGADMQVSLCNDGPVTIVIDL